MSLFIPTKVNNQSELEEIKLGLPLHFISQNQSNYDPPFPFTTRLVSPLESKTIIHFPKFFISLLIDLILVEGTLTLLQLVFQKKKMKLTPKNM
jgi:hypothetical protein